MQKGKGCQGLWFFCSSSLPTPGAHLGVSLPHIIFQEWLLPDSIQGCSSVFCDHSHSRLTVPTILPFLTHKLPGSGCALLWNIPPQTWHAAPGGSWVHLAEEGAVELNSLHGHRAPWVSLIPGVKRQTTESFVSFSLKPESSPYFFPEVESLSCLPSTGVTSFWIGSNLIIWFSSAMHSTDTSHFFYILFFFLGSVSCLFFSSVFHPWEMQISLFHVSASSYLITCFCSINIC